jgi:uncharacterized iron-regulated membrane protein
VVRQVFTLLHRFVGLGIAGFLFVSGLTGAVISWDHELDELLNPHLNDVASRGAFMDPLMLATAVAAHDERIYVTYVPLHPEEGHSLVFGVEPRFDAASDTLHDIGYNELFVDPVTGRIIGEREWGAAWPISRETFVSFLYVLHYSLHVPEFWGIDLWGLWFMGGIALLWTIDCFIGFYLTLPARKRASIERPLAVARKLARGWWSRWRPAWQVRWRGSSYRLTFDLHRAFSLWLWAILFILALSGVSLNLYAEIAQPVVSFLSSFSPTPYDVRLEQGDSELIEPKVTYARVLELGRAEAQRRGIAAPAGDIFYSPHYGVFGVRFFEPGDDHGAAGVGPPELYFDSEDGRYLGDWIPWRGTAGDLFLQLQFPLHSGRIAGLPGRIFISAMGLVVAMLSVTGVVIWYRKRRARKATAGRSSSRGLASRRPAQLGDTTTPPPPSGL